jgi:putative oxidoreductase
MTLGSLFIARLALAAIFLISVVGKIADSQSFIASLAVGGVPLAPVTGWAGILIELIAPLMLIIGWQARWAAVALAIFTAAASVIGHPFWTYAGEAAPMHQTQ